MTAVVWVPGTFYECREETTFYIEDVENYPVAVPLKNGDVVWCKEIVHRKGGRGRGRYAKLLHHRGEHHPRVVLYHRVSSFDRGAGDWEELNEMLVLALADTLPLD